MVCSGSGEVSLPSIGPLGGFELPHKAADFSLVQAEDTVRYQHKYPRRSVLYGLSAKPAWRAPTALLAPWSASRHGWIWIGGRAAVLTALSLNNQSSR